MDLKAKAKEVVSSLYDFYEDRLGLRPALIPPRSLNYNEFFSRRRTDYLETFAATGHAAFEIVKRETGISPDASLLDLGSGLGRLALPASRYLSPKGRYSGYDIVVPAIEWCSKNYKAFPNFSFSAIATEESSEHYAALDSRFSKVLQNENLHKSFKENSGAHFWEPDGTVDVVFSFSVFTHLLEPQVTDYLRETYRVLKPGGHSFQTTFLIDDESVAGMASGKATHHFQFVEKLGSYHDSLEFPLNTVGFAKEKALAMYVTAGFSPENLRVIKGSWSDPTLKSPQRYYQDVIIAKK